MRHWKSGPILPRLEPQPTPGTVLPELGHEPHTVVNAHDTENECNTFEFLFKTDKIRLFHEVRRVQGGHISIGNKAPAERATQTTDHTLHPTPQRTDHASLTFNDALPNQL